MTQRILALVIALLGASILTHKIAPLFAAGCIIAYGASQVARTRDTQHGILLFLISALLISVQWLYLTGFAAGIAIRAQAAFADGSAADLVDATHATALHSGIVGTIHAQINIIGLGLVAGLTWLILAWRYRFDGRVLFLLVLSAGTVAITGVAVVGGSSFAPARFVFLAELIFAILIGCLLAIFTDFDRPSARYVSIGLFAALLITQLIVAGAVPSDPTTPRESVTPAEMDARDYSQYVEGEIRTDFQYYTTSREFDDSFTPWGSGLLTGDIPRNTTVAHRSDVEVYHGTRYTGYWNLDWNPENELEKDCNTVYNNGDAAYHSC